MIRGNHLEQVFALIAPVVRLPQLRLCVVVPARVLFFFAPQAKEGRIGGTDSKNGLLSMTKKKKQKQKTEWVKKKYAKNRSRTYEGTSNRLQEILQL